MNYQEFLNKFGRKAILIELKPSYYRILLDNMKKIEHETKIPDLFSILETNEATI